MGKAVDYVAQQEKGKRVTVIDVEERGTPCRTCGATDPVFTVHCWREEARPVLALCQPCAIQRAGGEAKVAVRSDRSGLAEGWNRNQRPQLSERQSEQRRNAARRAQARCPAASGQIEA